MKKHIKHFAVLLVLSILVTSCFKDNDDAFASPIVVKNFIYRAMNVFYLYKPDVPVLDNDRFATTADLEAFHQQFSTPEGFFESLIFDRPRTDRFSIIASDYVLLEQALSGQGLNNGMEFGLVAVNGNPTDVFGYVRYVLPNSNAAQQGVTRGMIFTTVSGVQLTRANFRALLNSISYTIGLADLNAGVLTATGQIIALTKVFLQEDPIHAAIVIQQGTNKVGYLMYNSFLSQFDEQLNNAFAMFRAQGVTHLVLDLRYNGGGSVNTAIMLGSLISGNPTTDIFEKEEWNPEIQQLLLNQDPNALTSFFKDRTNGGTALASLNLSKVRIITSRSTASASELVINGLVPYIDVIQVGDFTIGKFQGSTTLYDSPNFRRSGANPAHRYALQPLIFKTMNSDGFTDYFDGLPPDIPLNEDFENLGILGDPTEPLLRACLDDILQNGRPGSARTSGMRYEEISGSNALKPFGNEMWRDGVFD
jgi:C-terminal processing protease CtpA/Prc